MADDPAPRQFVRQAKFARRLSVSRKSVTTWKTKGLIVVNDAGQVDVEASLARLRERPAKYRGGATTPTDVVTGEGGSVTPSEDRRPGNSADALPDPAHFGLDDPDLPTAEAVRRKENFLGLLRRHEYRVARGEYVRKSDTIAHFSRAFTGFKRQFQMAPARYASEMAGRLGVDAGAMHGELDRMIAATLAEMSAPIVLCHK